VKDKQTGAEQKLDDGFKSGGLGGLEVAAVPVILEQRIVVVVSK
jgi:hypothetical protein